MPTMASPHLLHLNLKLRWITFITLTSTSLFTLRLHQFPICQQAIWLKDLVSTRFGSRLTTLWLFQLCCWRAACSRQNPEWAGVKSFPPHPARCQPAVRYLLCKSAYWHEFSGESLEEGHRDDEEWLRDLVKSRPRGKLINACKYPKGQDPRGWDQVVFHSVQQQDKGQLEYRKFHTNMRKNFFPVRVIKHWNKLPRRLRSLLLWKYSRPVWIPSCEIYCRKPALLGMFN